MDDHFCANDTSAQPRMQRGDRAAVRPPVRRHLLMAPRPDRHALERLCRHHGPNVQRGEGAASGLKIRGSGCKTDLGGMVLLLGH
jgi:hypothetical protein